MEIGAITFFVKDMGKMVTFYRDVMNMAIEWDGDVFTGVKLKSGVFFNLCQRDVVGISQLGYPNGLNGTMEVSFGVPSPEDVDKEFDRLVKAGATPIKEPISQPYGLREAVVADPEGNLIEIVAGIPLLKPPISVVDWLEHNEILNDLLPQEESLTTHAMDHGFEAEVLKISLDQKSYVLKTWSKSSKPDVQSQYRLLDILFERGVAVSRPVGWGIDPNGDKVLLTSFDGTPIHKVNDKKMKELANILAKLHQIHIEELEHIELPKYDFIDYFFPEAREHADLNHAVTSLREQTPMKQDRIIHGDFHIGNIVEEQERYTVIDWTNGQLGDPRYDFEWSFVLLKIHISERYAEVFRSAYLLEIDIDQEELEVFEAWACLRWILLNRRGSTPKGPNVTKRVKSLIANNRFLKKLELKEISKLV
ncbi:phosphotransferase [Paenibacillus sp. FSL R10-2734]|uniref:phosphotransferase n=1 Tax=Paenibacillus sp. FSL R10-2734 TaxID=2954691 RepID=UPI0030DCEDC2